MYRIRSLEHKPLIIADAVITEYGENKVETLHVKNLLSLGEDRYLTTLMLKVRLSVATTCLVLTLCPFHSDSPTTR